MNVAEVLAAVQELRSIRRDAGARITLRFDSSSAANLVYAGLLELLHAADRPTGAETTF
jgi:hypothetical protein